MKTLVFKIQKTGTGVYRFGVSKEEAREMADKLNLKKDQSGGDVAYCDEEENILIETGFGISFAYEFDEDYGFKAKVDDVLKDFGYVLIDSTSVKEVICKHLNDIDNNCSDQLRNCKINFIRFLLTKFPIISKSISEKNEYDKFAHECSDHGFMVIENKIMGIK